MLKNATCAVVLAVAVLATFACSGCTSSGPEATDAQIRSEVATSLDAANIKGVQVSVVDGQVTLTGSVPDQATSDKVAEIAKGAKGAKGVTNSLVVSVGTGGPIDWPPEGPPPPVNSKPEILAAKVNQRLIAVPDLAGSKITATANEAGVVTLSGSVPSESAKAAAVKAAGSVDGVSAVADQTQVVAVAPVTSVPDPQLRDQINELLDKRFPDLILNVMVSNGSVNVIGAVPDRGIIVQVSNAIHAVPGVKAVDTSHLTVQGNTEGSDTIGAPAKKTP